MIPLDPLLLAVAVILYGMSVAILSALTGYYYGYKRGKGHDITEWLRELIVKGKEPSRIEKLFANQPLEPPSPIFKRGYLYAPDDYPENADTLTRISSMPPRGIAASKATPKKNVDKP